ncbi:MAG: sigma-70 family RNA polymerase sigma factor [Ignavibacteria bacterium]|nr:sigma-70 family RNA polymerase sigma factor [Ignavibacteria bacterium]
MNSNELEFQQIFKEYQPRILRYLTRLSGRYEAEDLSQEVFIKVESGLKNFRGDSKLSTWIYRIATNTAVDRMRNPSFKYKVNNTTSLEAARENDPEIEDKDQFSGEKAESTDQQYVRKEMNACIRNYIENLPENYRTVVLLSELEGLKNQEIAEILNLSLDTVKIRLHRARAQLRKKLESNCSFYQNEQNELSCDLRDEYEEFSKVY